MGGDDISENRYIVSTHGWRRFQRRLCRLASLTTTRVLSLSTTCIQRRFIDISEPYSKTTESRRIQRRVVSRLSNNLKITHWYNRMPVSTPRRSLFWIRISMRCFWIRLVFKGDSLIYPYAYRLWASSRLWNGTVVQCGAVCCSVLYCHTNELSLKWNSRPRKNSIFFAVLQCVAVCCAVIRMTHEYSLKQKSRPCKNTNFLYIK